MLLLLIFLLFATPGDSEFSSEVDCENNNRCLVLVNCTDSYDTERNPIKEVVLSSMDDDNNFCKEKSLEMLVEIDTRSARRFDFRVYYSEPLTEMNINGIVDITSEGATMKLGGNDTELSLTDSSQPRGGDGITANCSSYRFTIEVDGDSNLFLKFKQASFITVKRSTARRSSALYPWEELKSIRHNVRCDPSDLVDHCAADASIGEMYNNASDDEWLWVHGVACSDGFWAISRADSHWKVTSASIFCSEAPPICEFDLWKKVLMILLGIYCATSTIAIIALFVILYRKMDELKGPSQIVRMKGTRESTTSRSKSSSSSEKDKKKHKKLKQKNHIRMEQTTSENAPLTLSRIESSRNAMAARKKPSEKKGEEENVNPTVTDVERLKDE